MKYRLGLKKVVYAVLASLSISILTFFLVTTLAAKGFSNEFLYHYMYKMALYGLPILTGVYYLYYRAIREMELIRLNSILMNKFAAGNYAHIMVIISQSKLTEGIKFDSEHKQEALTAALTQYKHEFERECMKLYPKKNQAQITAMVNEFCAEAGF